MADADNPSTPSLAHSRLQEDWAALRTIRRGAKAVRSSGERFLVKFPDEDGDEYARRLKTAPWRPEFVDAVKMLSSKPFSRDVKLADGANDQMVSIALDVDGRGNNLHVFAKHSFEEAVAMGAHGILIDYPSAVDARTVAEERALGLRPYWVHVRCDDILAIETKQVGARHVVTYLRIRESIVERSGFAETETEQIREIEPGKWTIYRKGDKDSWLVHSTGVMTLDEVPFVLLRTGDNEGDQYSQPPLLDVADMQIELYNAGSKKEQAFTMAASPMLSAEGMAPPDDKAAKIVTGPNRVLFAPSTSDIAAKWTWLHPNAANLKEIRDDISEITDNLRRLAMQPMTRQAANTPALAFALDGDKTYTVLQAWALMLKDALEQAFVFTARWLKSEDKAPSVHVHTDFGVGVYGSDEVTALTDARKEGFISRETYWDELQRRGVLSPAFDADAETERLNVEFPPFTVPDDDQSTAN